MQTKYRTCLVAEILVLIFSCGALIASDSNEIKVVIERNVPVPMRDGTILRADVHRPDRGGPYPVLVRRTPYWRIRSFDQFVKAGYIVVCQFARGRYGSGGRFESMCRFETHDAEDGYDTVEWAAKLRGSTGKVGTFGNSLEALYQWRLAALDPPSLVATSAISVAGRLWDAEKPCALRPGARMEWLQRLAFDMRRRAGLPGVGTEFEYEYLRKEESDKWTNWLPLSDLPQDFFAYETDTLKSWLRDPHADPWRLDEGCKDITVPNLDMVGWYDFANGDMLLYRTMVKEAKTETARKDSRIIMGPWGHTGLGMRRSGPIDFGRDAVLDISQLQIRWFDHWLKGIENGVEIEAPVKIFVMGDNEWRDEQHWPLQRTEEMIFFITSEERANTPSGDGKLVIARPGSSASDAYVYDPADPVPTPFGAQIPRATDQRFLADRDDILVYQTDVLTERVEVTGNPSVELYAASSAPDTDWFVRLIDVSPDGLSRDVSSGMVRARYRDGFEDPKLIRPGEIVKYTIRMDPTSNAFLPGHRIRLDVTSSDFPNFDRNHNTAANQYADGVLVTAHQAIYHGGEYATRVILPRVPNQTVHRTARDESGPTTESAKDQCSLHRAAAVGDVERINALLSGKADIDEIDDMGVSALYYAVEAGKIETVEFLLKAGADINAGIWPPLYAAVDTRNAALAEYLLVRGGDLRPSLFWSPLAQAANSGSAEIVELFIDAGADVNAGEPRGWSKAIRQDRVEILGLFMREGLDMNNEDQNGMTPLVTAVIREETEIIELLRANGAQIDHRNDLYGFTALHYAARFGKRKSAEALIAHGADIAAKDKWDYQPIHWAAYHDRPEIIELLIAKGADVNAKTSLSQTPLELAIPRRNTKTIEVLSKYNNDTDSDKPYVVLERGDVRAVIVNNEPVNDDVLPGHRGGYSGVASLTHRVRDKNLFVPFYAGLNFEHIHDGTNQPRDILFEPRRAPMQIKRIDEYTAELYQPLTPHWQLESWLRYKLLEDGVIEMTLECVPRVRTFKNDYIGLFFASYINKPESLDIHFLGRPANDSSAEARWIRGVTPEHGTLPTHLAVDDNRKFAHDPNFPLTLVFNKSNYRYTEPWYYGVSGGMAFVLMFRPEDNVRFSQSPSGGGKGNPAWDFQWFVPQYKVGQRYRFVMRAMYLPFESRRQIIRATAPHRAALARQ